VLYLEEGENNIHPLILTLMIKIGIKRMRRAL
jgi:hypothetical protein